MASATILLTLLTLSTALVAAKDPTPGYNIEVNNGCPIDKCDTGKFGAIAAISPLAQPHVTFLWSTIGAPTLFGGVFSSPAIVSYNWDQLLTHNFADNAITIPKFERGLAIVFSDVIEFNDTDKKAKMTDDNILRVKSMADFQWKVPRYDPKEGTININTTDDSLQLLLHCHNQNGRDSQNPDLSFTANSTSLTVLVQNYTYAKGSMKSKLAVRWDYISVETQKLETDKTIDDEYTPSTFYAKSVNIGEDQGYVLWKPIVYGSLARKPTNSTFAVISDLTPGKNLASFDNTSVAASLFEELHPTINTATLTFGQAGDKVYNPNTLVFSVVAGLGKRPKESFSPALLITILATCGLPAASFLVAFLVSIYRKCAGSAEKSGYSSIQ